MSIKKRKVELLAPAGDFSCFRAAINAGADAVYLGGSRFGARAYANNFTEEEIIKAVRLAHLFEKKVYLTVNTLIKENEIQDIVPYITPLYESGLDGVIVQDIGVVDVLHKNFPDLEIHASTQMTITGVYGARFVKDMGINRIVPARELSLTEIADIKKATGLEIETFIHGAMCYGYSGQCLFSSILGGRSGNRGRCAGPCRLPYTNDKNKTVYPLSLKDMYTLPLIPELIEAGIDSFKIEGRMKSPEYVAGVTAMYRKYIDKYLLNPDAEYTVSKKDEEMLKNLYIRTDICNGYYKQHNSRSMVTISEPGYCGNSKEVIDAIHNKYINNNISIKIQAYARICAGENAMLTLYNDDFSVTVEGENVSSALNRPLSEDDIAKRFEKTGDTVFEIESIIIDTDNQSFMPVKALNELRRNACDELEKAVLEKNNCRKNRYINKYDNYENKKSFEESALYALINTKEQFEEILKFPEIKGIYVSSEIIISNYRYFQDKVNEYTSVNFFMAMPAILRKRSYGYLSVLEKVLKENNVKGVLVRNYEELQWLYDINYSGEMISDFSVYAWNSYADRALMKHFNRITIPLELNRKEVLELSRSEDKEVLVYGRIPLMYSANCIKNTLEKCDRDGIEQQSTYKITDRYNNIFTIVQNCHHCYNILYNTIPLSLHNHLDKLLESNYSVYRLDFTIESEAEVHKIADYYVQKIIYGNKANYPFDTYTNGHHKRGAE